MIPLRRCVGGGAETCEWSDSDAQVGQRPRLPYSLNLRVSFPIRRLQIGQFGVVFSGPSLAGKLGLDLSKGFL
jgi:hypothetical protein